MPCEENFKRVKGWNPVSAQQSVYAESIMCLDTTQEYSFTRTILVQTAQTITVFVKNTGDCGLKAFLQNSPNGIDFINDKQMLELEKGDMGYIVPYIFSKYIRLGVAGVKGGKAQIWVQIQHSCCCQQPEIHRPC